VSIFRKFILKEWFLAFAGSFAALLLLISVSNLIAGFLRSNVSPYEVIINYLLELPSFLNKVIPVSCLMASLFSLNKLKNRNELEAIYASGFSRKKLLETIVIGSVAIAFGQFIISGYVGPFAKKYRHAILKDSVNKFGNMKSKGLKASTIGSGKMWYKSGDYFFSFASFDQQNQKLDNITLYSIGKDSKLYDRIEAPSAKYKGEKKWTLTNGVRQSGLHTSTFPTIEKFKEIDIFIDEGPSDLKELESDITTLNVVELYSYIKNIKSSGINTNEYEVMFYGVFSAAAMCVILSLVSSRSIFKPSRRGSSFGKTIGFVLIFTILYWLAHSYLTELGNNDIIHPLLACFGVPISFSLYLTYVFYHHRQLR